MSGSTLKTFLQLLIEWGPYAGLAALWIVYQIIRTMQFKKKLSQYNEADAKRDKEIEKLRVARGEILERLGALELQHQKELADFRVELEKRTTYTWMESKVLPRIDELAKSTYELTTVVQILVKKCKILGHDETL